MSPAEIEKLKALRPDRSILRYAESLELALPRLLAERERLLADMRKLEAMGAFRDSLTHWGEVRDLARAAISFAEAPPAPAPPTPPSP